MLALALQAVAAFNLVCTGTFSSGRLFVRPDVERQTVTTLRVDLDRGRWCSGDCLTTAPIYRVTDTQIIFQYENDTEAQMDGITSVNRESGEYFDRRRLMLINTYSMTMGTCTRAPFTGFPQRRF